MAAGSTEYRMPDALVDTGWLAGRLNDPDLRVYDCTTHLIPHHEKPYIVKPGLEDYQRGHIPGSAFLDIQGELSDNASHLRFTFPKPDALAAAFGRVGIGDGATVVLYSQTTPQWATRVWWMLRAMGFDTARVLDGGQTKWKQEGRPLETEPRGYPAASFTARPRPGLIVQKDEVLAALGNSGACVINALRAEQHAGKGGTVYGRPGRIAGTVNVPTVDLLDPATTAFLPADYIARQFGKAGADKAERVITYCGGGIAASATAMLLTMLGYENVGLYDNSMSEWAVDETLPMEVG